MFLRCILKRKKKDIKMNRTLKIFVANSNVKFILKKKGQNFNGNSVLFFTGLSVKIYLLIFIYLNDLLKRSLELPP
ncbi:hypothetical protein BpHYR1_012694 [Brachionus plicatilis]|uniref:Uncharacterized protein n=1 Tax=Brachionus plicatilis TaxID=10195 RepID=A0A3M7Q1V3_BRAPC|nr:hypothetical protein BpHYR1_012694 [Brachionus plicatilis]